MNKNDLIKHYQMEPHPEGGYFKETYRSEIEIDSAQGIRNSSTAIHFLITDKSISHLHRLKSDEGWHFHLGSPLRLIEIAPNGKLIETIIGPDISKGQKLQHFVPAGNWFASTSLGEFSFVGCTVSPGFDFNDFVMGKKAELSKIYPEHSGVFERYCLD